MAVRSIWPFLVITLTLDKAACAKFEFCGKKPGVVTASRGAALATKYIQKCGKDIILGYPWTTSNMIKIAGKCCLAVQICYEYHKEKKQQDVQVFRTAIRQCLVEGSLALYAIKPEAFAFNKEEFSSMMQHFNMCLRGDMLPTDASVFQASLRYLVNTFSLGHSIR
ncbi:uncharacterized protein LOC142571002 isoform X1 [Dermacentor variabilis]|uniref:uncharacterized protein LOC142571002 isoform X1 n=1 Tax=Dermacentor variabilis TaxID=34621 RepID=UPI003F5B6232